GSPSEGSPRRIAKSAYRAAGTPYRDSTSASSNSRSSDTPRSVNSTRTTGSRTSWSRSRSPVTISNRSPRPPNAVSAPIASSASHRGARPPAPPPPPPPRRGGGPPPRVRAPAPQSDRPGQPPGVGAPWAFVPPYPSPPPRRPPVVVEHVHAVVRPEAVDQPRR